MTITWQEIETADRRTRERLAEEQNEREEKYERGEIGYAEAYEPVCPVAAAIAGWSRSMRQTARMHAAIELGAVDVIEEAA